MLKALYLALLRFMGVLDLYRDIVERDPRSVSRAEIRADLVHLLSEVNHRNPYFRGDFTSFLEATGDADDDDSFGRTPGFRRPARKTTRKAPVVESETRRLLRDRTGTEGEITVRFVEFMDHDYRRKYRVIERSGEVEFAGGIVGDPRKSAVVERVMGGRG